MFATFKMSQIAVCVNLTVGCGATEPQNSIRGITIGHWRPDDNWIERVEIPFGEFSKAGLLERLTKVARPLVEWEKYQHERGKRRNRRFFKI